MSHDVCDDHAGSQFTGTAINPARALGPAIVFHCHWNVIWLYVIAGMSAAAISVAIQRTFVKTALMMSHFWGHSMLSVPNIALAQAVAVRAASPALPQLDLS